ncbi:RICIN domain-containing protein [Micromonospora gifhornensis]|uniref:Ricin B lectin domain-containing protein n=1 Tax=Micromonospora gifhornensis TaxID=84594 RepID=A0ABQ4IG35_9ACTN|nr:RICIN domain-containing protein [Micromonospora gifhornensis]GIJ16872.1 hypothetical protein Vgi01_35560 [Micromonospora gifhornensis]
MSETDGPGTVYGTRRGGLLRDPLLGTALAIGLIGILAGVVFATGALDDGDPPPAANMAVSSAPSTEPSPTEEQPPPTTQAPEPTPSATSSAAPDPLVGPKVFAGVGSGLCLGLDGAGERAIAELAVCTGGPEQRWIVSRYGPDTVTLTNAAYNQCLDVEGGSGDDGARLLQYGCHGEVNQQWRLQPVDGGAILLVAVHSGKCAQVHGGGTAAGDDVTQAPCNGNPAQRWTLR